MSIPPARRLAPGLCGLGGLALAALAAAQSPLPAEPPAYQDRYIAGGTLAPEVLSDELAPDDAAAGLARSLQVDGVLARLRSSEGDADHSITERGLVAKAQWETAAYGAWSLEGAVHGGGDEPGAPSHGRGLVSLRERGLAFDGGWVADNALGDINAAEIALARLQPRFYLPTTPMEGLTTEWRGPHGLQITAGGGEPGLYAGLAVPGFATLGGSTAAAGVQWSPAAHWTVGGQLIEAHDVALAAGPLVDLGQRLSATTGLASALYETKGARLQLNVLDGSVSGLGNGIGGWVDGSVVRGRIQQSAGLFRIDPDLTWGNQLISNDAQGGYYRFGYQSRQWLADVGIDAVRSVSGLGANTTFLTSDARYQLSRDWGVGGVANLSHTGGGASWSAEGYVDHANRFGTGRVQADTAHTPTGSEVSLALDQAWSTLQGFRLNTTLSLERIQGALIDDAPQSSTVLGLAVNGGGQLTNGLSLEANVRWSSAVEGRAAPGVAATVTLNWQLSSSWQLLATYYDSTVGSWTPITVSSPLTPPSEMPVPAVRERGGFLTVRYQRAAGAHFAPLGGAPGGGAGALAGAVFLDANDDGRLDNGEAGAPNVTVVLDGRFSVQTDAYGRFEFPVVAAGRHVLTVVSDNLPLPWFLANDGRTEVEVGTRSRTQVTIAAHRIR
ncbi:MAG: hypothetical protein JSR73_11665 [Proteobacteria bacterium]|nr:hypothetical protein [Pseudomonadota bacterium]